MSVAVADTEGSAVVKKKAGRPARIKATPQLVDAAVADIMTGLSIESALVLRGIAVGSVSYFLRLHPEAKEAFDKAERDFEKIHVSRIHAAAERDPKWSTWLLERRVGHRWAPLAKSEVSGPNGGPIQTLTLGKQLLATVAIGSDKVKREIPVGPSVKGKPKLD